LGELKMKTLNSIALLAVLPLSANAACPNFSGTFAVTSITSSDGQNSSAPTGALMVITQTGCSEVDVTVGGSQDGSAPQKYIVDGQPHPWASVSDVNVSFTETSSFQGNSLVATLGMASMAGMNIGTIEYALDATGSNLTFSMTTPNSTQTVTAVRQ
jgi:hypothetical protein